MLDAAYFRDRLPQDVRDKHRLAPELEVCVKVHLHGGASYNAARTVDVGPGWVVLDAYVKKKRQPAREAIDRVTLAFNAISHVTIAARPPRGIGFRTDDDVMRPA